MRTFNKLLCVAVCLPVFALFGCDEPKQQHHAPVVAFDIVKSGPVQINSELQGRISAFLVSEVRPQVSGIIQQRLFTEGSDVQEGDTLYQIDPALYEAALENAKAALLKAEAVTRASQTLAERYRVLVRAKAISQQEYDNALADYNSNQASVIAAKAALDTARINLDYTKVKAPVSGRVGASSVTPGALVTANQPSALATIQQLDKMYVDVTQSSVEVMRMRERFGQNTSQPVQLKFHDGSFYRHNGTIKFFDVTVDPRTDMVTVRATFPNEEGILLPGMFARTVLLEGVDENGILIPQDTVAYNPRGLPYVLVLEEAPEAPAPNFFKVTTRPVEIGGNIGNQWYITAGISAGDKLMVSGRQKAGPGATVMGMPAGAAQAAQQGEKQAQEKAGAAR